MLVVNVPREDGHHPVVLEVNDENPMMLIAGDVPGKTHVDFLSPPDQIIVGPRERDANLEGEAADRGT